MTRSPRARTGARRKLPRADRLSLVLAGGIAANTLRLRQRLRALPVLDAQVLGVDQADAPTARDWRWVVLDGVHVDDATRTAAVAHAEQRGLDVLDLVPGDLPVEQALDLVRRVDPQKYRDGRLLPGMGALHAILATADVLARSGIEADDHARPAQLLDAARALKLHAATSTDLAIAPQLEAADADPTADPGVIRALYGAVLPVVSGVAVAEQSLFARGLRRRTAAGAAPFALHAVQPALAFAGSALRPRDLSLPGLALRSARRSRRAGRDLARHHWGPDEATARQVAEKRPGYEAQLARGVDALFEPPRPDCPLCGGADLRTIVRSRDLLQGKPGIFLLDECTACRHVFQNPRLSVEGLDFYYGDCYDGLGAQGADQLFASNEAPYLGRARMLEGHAEPRRWLDVGGGHGHFALVAASVWPKTTFDLLDMSDSVDEALRRGWVGSGYRGFFPDLAEELAGSYDVVSMHHYLEHTRDPMAELDAAARVLEPGGHLLVEVPNPDDPIARPLKWLWGPWFQPQHQHFVSLGNLTGALEQRGFTVVATHVSEAHQEVDLAFLLWNLANRLAPTGAMPWVPPRTLVQRVHRATVFGALGPFMALGLVLDRVLAPLMRAIPGRSNTYRVLARRN